jgi:hypothetical protein
MNEEIFRFGVLVDVLGKVLLVLCLVDLFWECLNGERINLYFVLYFGYLTSK